MKCVSWRQCVQENKDFLRICVDVRWDVFLTAEKAKADQYQCVYKYTVCARLDSLFSDVL